MNQGDQKSAIQLQEEAAANMAAKNTAGDWLPYYPEDFVIHEIPSSMLEDYMRGERVISSTDQEFIRRPGGLYLKQMQHERHELHHDSLYRVRLIWSRQ